MAENVLILSVTNTDGAGTKTTRNYSGWKTMSVRRSMQEICGTFSLRMTDIIRGENKPLIQGGDACEISIVQEPGDEPILIMTGFVEIVRPSLSDQISFTVEGRDKTADLVDCVVTAATEWKDIKFERFVEEVVAPHNIEVVRERIEDTGENIKTINYDTGTKIYELIAKHALLKQLVLYTLPDGRLIITRTSDVVIDRAMIEGDNIKAADGVSDWTEVFSEYTVKGSRASTGKDTKEKDATQSVGCTLDTRVNRFRPIIIVPDSETENVSAKARSEWEATIRIARSEGWTIEIQGWLPVVNQLAYIEIPTFAFKGNLLIESYELIADEKGKRTILTFVHPRSFEPLATENVEASDLDTLLNLGGT